MNIPHDSAEKAAQHNPHEPPHIGHPEHPPHPDPNLVSVTLNRNPVTIRRGQYTGAELKAAFEKHHDQTEGQVERLVEVFGIIDKKPQGKTCPAIDGWVTTRLAPRGGPVSWRPAHSSAAGAGRR